MQNDSMHIDASMWRLFQSEIATCTQQLSKHLLLLEQRPNNVPELLMQAMQAAHSIKGAAAAVQIETVISLAHAVEEILISLQTHDTKNLSFAVQQLLIANDEITVLTTVEAQEIQAWIAEHSARILQIEYALRALLQSDQGSMQQENTFTLVQEKGQQEASLHVEAEQFDRIIAQASESFVQAQKFSSFLLHLHVSKKQYVHSQKQFNRILSLCSTKAAFDKHMQEELATMKSMQKKYTNHLSEKISQGDNLSCIIKGAEKLYRNAISIRLRPFSEGLHLFPRFVRDMARQLKKNVRFEIRGVNTQVDRDILDKLQSPLSHLLRNCLHHGIEMPAERKAQGKNEQGFILLEARHHAGMLQVTVQDDGKGIDVDALRTKIAIEGLCDLATAQSCSIDALFTYLLLPGFSTAEHVSAMSGRGVGLDVVRALVEETKGSIKIFSEKNKGTKIELRLPITRSVMRALLVSVAGDIYAFPLAQMERVVKIHRNEIYTLEARQYIDIGNSRIALVSAAEIFGLPSLAMEEEHISLVLIRQNEHKCWGVIVDRFIAQQEVLVHPIDERLGNIAAISAATITDAGDPALIVDIEDLRKLIDNLLQETKC